MKSQQVGAIDRFLAAAPLEAAANHDGGRDKGDPEMARWVLFQQRWLTRLGPVKELVSKKCFLVIPFQNFHSREIYGRPCAECSRRRGRNQTDDTSGIQERGGAQKTDPPKIFPEERKQITREDPQKPVTLKEKRTRKDNQSKEKVKKQGGDRGRRAEGGEKRE